MKAQPERKWNLAKAGILAAFGVALAGLAVALPPSTQPPAGGAAAPHAAIAATGTEDDARVVAPATSGSRDPSLAGLRVSPDAKDAAPIETD